MNELWPSSWYQLETTGNLAMQTSHQTKLFSICLECFDLFINQTQVKIHSQEADTEKFLCNRFFFYLKRLISFVMMEFLVGKWCLYTVCILYSAQFTYWTRSFICEVYYQIVCAVRLSVTICLFVD